MSFEPIARIPESTQPMMAPNIKINVWVTEDQYQGLHSLLNWLQGFEAAGKGVIPGHPELVFFFRGLTAAIREAKKIS